MGALAAPLAAAHEVLTRKLCQISRLHRNNALAGNIPTRKARRHSKMFATHNAAVIGEVQGRRLRVELWHRRISA
jgi:hypothetical protein